MTTALEEGEGSVARPGRTFTPQERPDTHCTGGLLGHGRSGRAENLAPPGFFFNIYSALLHTFHTFLLPISSVHSSFIYCLRPSLRSVPIIVHPPSPYFHYSCSFAARPLSSTLQSSPTVLVLPFVTLFGADFFCPFAIPVLRCPLVVIFSLRYRTFICPSVGPLPLLCCHFLCLPLV